MKLPFIFAAFLLGFASSTQAVTFYVSSKSGNDASDGRTPQTAWRSLGAVTSRVSQLGADVLLESGSVFENQTVELDWGGAVDDPSTLGCYALGTNGAPRACTTADRKPEINGTFELACAQTKTCALDSNSAVPSSQWGALVSVKASHVVVSQLKLKDSAGIPITIGETAVKRTGFVFEDLDIEGSVNYVVLVNHGANQGVIRRIKAQLFNRCHEYRFPQCNGGGWPSGILIANTPLAYVVVEDSEVSQGFGEGVACMRSSHVVVRRNRVGNLVSNGFYIDNCSNALVENNITWGDKNGRYNPQGSFAAVAIGQEDFTAWGRDGPKDSVNNVVRNNLFTGFGVCMWAFQYDGPRLAGKKIGFVAYGNTCVAQRTNAIFFEQSVGAENVTEIVVANNVFHSTYEDRDCISTAHPRVKFNANLWPVRPTNVSCRGANDVYGDPKMKSSIVDLAARNNLNQPKPADFALAPDSPALEAGLTLAGASSFSKESFPVIESTQNTRCPLEESPLPRDYHCVSRQDPPSIGAIDRSKYPPRAPMIVASP